MENSENNNLPKYRLIGASSVLILLIIIGFISLRQPEYTYELEPEEALEYALSGEYEITPEEVSEIVSGQNSDYRLVDLRSPYDYVKGHLEGAVNIPYESLMEEKNLAYFKTKDSLITILYGKNQLQANGPLMILKQLGYENLKVMLGGYDYYSTHSLSYRDMPEQPEYLVEEPRYDFAKVIAETVGSEMIKPDMEQPEIIIPVRKKKKSVVEGGC